MEREWDWKKKHFLIPAPDFYESEKKSFFLLLSPFLSPSQFFFFLSFLSRIFVSGMKIVERIQIRFGERKNFWVKDCSSEDERKERKDEKRGKKEDERKRKKLLLKRKVTTNNGHFTLLISISSFSSPFFFLLHPSFFSLSSFFLLSFFFLSPLFFILLPLFETLQHPNPTTRFQSLSLSLSLGKNLLLSVSAPFFFLFIFSSFSHSLHCLSFSILIFSCSFHSIFFPFSLMKEKKFILRLVEWLCNSCVSFWMRGRGKRWRRERKKGW